MKLKIVIAVTVFTLFASGCKQDVIRITHHNTIFGEWLSHGTKKISSTVYAKVVYREKFLIDGDLYSTKWFNFKDKQGNDLGEFYITKLFNWSRKSNKISAKFVRCQTGITKPLRANNLGYKKLKKMCDISYYKNGRVITKAYKFIGNKLLLGNRVYEKIGR